MILTVYIYNTDEEGPPKTIRLDGATGGFTLTPPGDLQLSRILYGGVILYDPATDVEREVFAHSEPELWMRSLYKKYRGVAVSASKAEES